MLQMQTAAGGTVDTLDNFIQQAAITVRVSETISHSNRSYNVIEPYLDRLALHDFTNLCHTNDEKDNREARKQ